MFEVEQKYRVADADDLRRRLLRLGAKPQAVQHHSDTYYNHPSRDFAESGEAFRIRRVDGVPLITYKGPKLAGAMKAREELEWRLDPGDPDGEQMEKLLRILGFRLVACVQKKRCPYTAYSAPFSQIAIVVDEVENLGLFAELEQIVGEKSEIDGARARIQDLSQQLGLRTAEPRSYLELVLEYQLGNPPAESWT